ncbi:MAG: GH25 family lysozyme [Archangium sp.]
MADVWGSSLVLLLISACWKPELAGVDVSHHNKAIDWRRVAASGVSFAWVKASEGGDVVDERYAANASHAREAGLLVGAYHFFTFCRPGADQAANFLAVAPVFDDALAPAVDVEFVGNCRNPPEPEVIRRELEVFIGLVEAKWNRPVVVYTTPDADEALLKALARPRWIRSIGKKPRGAWRIWQRDDAASVDGIEGPVDLDVFRGTRAELSAL